AVVCLVAPALGGLRRAAFRLGGRGALSGALPDSLPDDGLLRDLSVTAAPGGITFELAVDADAAGWRLERDPDAGRVTLTLSRAGEGGLEGFSAEGAAGPGALRVSVLDPGQGAIGPLQRLDWV